MFQMLLKHGHGKINWITFTEHFLEHLTVPNAIELMANASRALKFGGKIRLSTPSLEWVLSSHFALDVKDASSRTEDAWAIHRAFKG